MSEAPANYGTAATDNGNYGVTSASVEYATLRGIEDRAATLSSSIDRLGAAISALLGIEDAMPPMRQPADRIDAIAASLEHASQRTAYLAEIIALRV